MTETSPTTEAPKASKVSPAIEAATNKTPRVRVGEVVSLAVKVPGGAKPTFRVDGQGEPVYARRTSGSDVWTAAWIPSTDGDHDVTVTALGDVKPVVFIVTATPLEEN